MISTPFIDRYSDGRLGEIALMLSLEGMWELMPLAGLKLETPEHLRQICVRATMAARDVVYDEDEVMAWVRWEHLIGHALRQDDFASMTRPDLMRFYDWLENGMMGTAHEFPYRVFWDDACTWAARYDEIAALVDSPDLDVMREFATGVLEAIKDPEYDSAKQKLAQNQDSYFDTWQKTKFHINFVPDVMICPPLIPINFMRRAHILRGKTDAYLAEGGDPEVLERMAILFAERKETSKYLKDYATNHAAFRVENLWSNRFREAVT